MKMCFHIRGRGRRPQQTMVPVAPVAADELFDSSGAMMTTSNGDKIWKLNGQIHRMDGPAIIRPDGDQIWYQHDQPHRTVTCPP